MIKVKCNKGLVRFSLEGDYSEILTDIAFAVHNILREIAANELEYEVYKATAIGLLNKCNYKEDTNE